MTVHAFVCLCISLGAQFDVQGISLSEGKTWVIQAQMAPGPQCDFLALTGHTLQFYSGLTLQPCPALTLNEGTCCFDLADIDADGKNDVVAVQGDRIMVYALPEAGKTVPPPRELFSLPSMLSALDQIPRPYTLVVWKEGRPLIALPVENSIELRTLDSTLDMTFGLAPENSENPNERSHFSVLQIYPNRRGSEGALECSVSRGMRSTLDYPDFLKPSEDTDEYKGMRWVPTSNAYNTPPTENKSTRPWFPLKTTGETDPRVAYEYKNPGWMSTKLCIMSVPPQEDKSLKPTATIMDREREYPGQAIITAALPDFNGDGYTDLLLWKTTPPGTSVDAITRAIAGGSWKIVFTVHLYSPEEGRYELLPTCTMDCYVPLATFISMWNFVMIPFSNIFLCDFNGDGRTDFGCSPSDATYSVWIYGERGFNEEPDFSRSFKDSILSASVVDIEGNGSTQLLIKTENNFFVVRVR